MIAIDWSHIKELTTYDGKKIRVESRKALLKRITESTITIKSTKILQVIIEQGCPLSLCYDKCKEDIREKYPDYTKIHCHNASLNRTATFLAKHIYKSVVGDSRNSLNSTVVFHPTTDKAAA